MTSTVSWRNSLEWPVNNMSNELGKGKGMGSDEFDGALECTVAASKVLLGGPLGGRC